MSWPRPPLPGTVCCQPAARPPVGPCCCRGTPPDPSRRFFLSSCWKQSHSFSPVNHSQLCACVLWSQGSQWPSDPWMELEGVPEFPLLPRPLTGLRMRMAPWSSGGARRWRRAASLLPTRCCGWRLPAPCRRRVPTWCSDPCGLAAARSSPWLCGRSLCCPQPWGVAG